MSDVDDELLALAGGGDSSDEEEGSPRSAGRAESETPPPAAKKKEAPTKGVATKKAPVKKTKKRGNQDDSEEEGEARSPTPSSPSSLQSAPMEESDSEAEAVPASSRNDDEDKYPYEGLYRNAAEKAKIQNMNQLEREMIINERQEEKTRIQQNKLLRQLVRNDEQRNKKRSASTADLEENQRKTSRVRTKLGGTKVGETNAALDTLKSRRAEKSARDRRREEDRERRKDRSPSYQNDRGGASDSESDVEWARPDKSKRRSRTPELKEAAPAELVDVERVRMSRSRFAKVCFYPGFEEAIKGCFVRISIGQDKATGENIYRIGYIKGFTKDKPYVILGDQGQQVVTNLYCVATHGKASREWPFIACSDSRFTEAEWTRYKTVCEVESVVIPKKPALFDKAADINNLLDRKWTEPELNDKLARQQDLKNLFNGVQKKKLEFEMEAAKKGGDSDKLSELQEKLDDLKTSRLAYRTSLTPLKNSSKPGTPTQQERLAQVNAENRRRNAEAVRKAQLAERAKAREIERKIERGELVDEDTSRRVKTKTKFLHDPNEIKRPNSTAGSGASTPANGTPRLGAQKQPLLPHLAKLQQQKAVDKNGIPTIHKPLMDDDIIGALDLDIDENLLD